MKNESRNILRYLKATFQVLTLALGLFAAASLGIAQNPPASGKPDSDRYRIAGTVVSKIDGHPLAQARVLVTSVGNSKISQTVVTSEDGKFEFPGLPAGKYSLSGARRGFITAAYDQHDQYSTAIVTGTGLETENLFLKLVPNAIVSGSVLDEAGEPVRHASVTLYYDDHLQGVDQIHAANHAQTNDLGAFELASLRPGTYFLAVTATPWYAVHPRAQGGPPATDTESDNVSRSLDVAYPVTYYADVTDPDSATPIPVRGGERLQVDIHLNPAPALKLIFRTPKNGPGSPGKAGFVFPQLEQQSFDGSTPVQPGEMMQLSPGVWQIGGVAAGQYNIRLQGAGGMKIDGVTLSKDGEVIDASNAQAASDVKVSVRMSDGSALPKRFGVGLRSNSRNASGRMVDEHGQAEFSEVYAGNYEVVVWGFNKPYAIGRMSGEGVEVSGHSLTLTPGSSPSISLSIVEGTIDVNGTAKRAGKDFAGAMVVLVPKDPAGERDLFRRDQSDLDGTFSLRNVVPGSYTVLAIEDGWDLDWSQPEVIGAYLKRGRSIEVGAEPGHRLNLSEPVEVQSK